MNQIIPYSQYNLDGINESEFLVQSGYNISNNSYSSYNSSSGVFEKINQLISMERITKDDRTIKATYEGGSKLNYGELKNNSFNHFNIEGNLNLISLMFGKRGMNLYTRRV